MEKVSKMSDTVVKSIIAGDRRIIAKTLTLVESSTLEDRVKTQTIISKLFAFQNKKTRVVGFSGITGSGKSSLIDKLGEELLKENNKIAVLAIDPSSPVHGGSILGDKTRMSILTNNPNCFVRPVPSKFNNGGISKSTREAIAIFRAAGYDYIFIETVGVGQTEYSVSNVCDLLILNLLPATGDELQGIKKGINELADIILVNKADGPLEAQAEITVNEYSKTLNKPIISTSILKKESIKKIVGLINEFYKNNPHLISKKIEIVNKEWAKSLAMSYLSEAVEEAITDQDIKNPYESLDDLLQKLKDLI